MVRAQLYVQLEEGKETNTALYKTKTDRWSGTGTFDTRVKVENFHDNPMYNLIPNPLDSILSLEHGQQTFEATSDG